MHERGQGRIFQRGSRWWIAYYVSGREIRESGGTTEKAAQQRLNARRSEIDGRRFIGPEQERLTVNDLLDALQIHLTNKGVKSRSYLSHAKPIRRWFGTDRAVQVHAARVERFIAEELQDGKSPATVNREVTVLKQAYHLARKHMRLSHVPYFPRLHEDNARQGFFEHEEFEAILKFLPGYLADVARFAYLTSWRSSEIRGLRWDAVDRKEGEIRLRTSKNGSGRVLPLEGPLVELLEKRWLAREVHRSDGSIALATSVFHRDGHPIGDFRKAWTTACKHAKTPGKLFHDFRRTAVRNMIRAGVPQAVAMSISGHKTVSMFNRYDITSDADKRDAIRRVSQHLTRHGASTTVLPFPQQEAGT